jgi:uroporphyrinogen-III synthase
LTDAGLPLAGLGVLVTRNPGEWPALLARLEALGASATFRSPTIQAEPADPEAVDAAVDALDTFAWIAFTSGSGVRSLAEAARRRGIAIGGGAPRFACVGEGTARVLASVVGRAADLVAEDGTGRGLARALLARRGAGDRVLVVRPEVSAGGLERALREGGADFDEVAVYRTVPAPWVSDLATSILRGHFAVVVFTAPSAFRSILEAPGAGDDRVASALARTTRVAIGPTTAEALAGASLAPDAVAERPDEEAVEAAIVAAVARRRDAGGVC